MGLLWRRKSGESGLLLLSICVILIEWRRVGGSISKVGDYVGLKAIDGKIMQVDSLEVDC